MNNMLSTIKSIFSKSDKDQKTSESNLSSKQRSRNLDTDAAFLGDASNTQKQTETATASDTNSASASTQAVAAGAGVIDPTKPAVVALYSLTLVTA
jgi:hypothetical protein